MMLLSRLYNPHTLKYKLVLWVGWRMIPLTGFWFGGYNEVS